ncbi:MAG: YqeG family HAD IIIA-type phosphatase [Cyanobacteriota bacterium]
MVKSFISKYLKPDKTFRSVDEINLDDLKTEGIRGIILDLDDTLIPSDKKTPKEKINKWVKKAKKDFSLFVVSNNSRTEYVKKFCEKFDIPFVAQASKPRGKFLEKAMLHMKLKKKEVIIVGDRVTTDILAGKLFGIKAFLVKPLTKMPSTLQRIVYKVENYILLKIET